MANIPDTTSISTLKPDIRNANRGTVRGLGQVERSLQQYGAGRSILASSDGVILAGNKTHDLAVELGIPIQEIESDGKTLFVIRRTDLAYDDPRAKELAIADNRASETASRYARVMEVDPKYCDVICQRYFNFTGIAPVRESDGVEWGATA